MVWLNLGAGTTITKVSEVLLENNYQGWGGGGRDEAWDQEKMLSQLAKQSPCVMVSR